MSLPSVVEKFQCQRYVCPSFDLTTWEESRLKRLFTHTLSKSHSHFSVSESFSLSAYSVERSVSPESTLPLKQHPEMHSVLPSTADSIVYQVEKPETKLKQIHFALAETVAEMVQHLNFMAYSSLKVSPSLSLQSFH